MSIRSTTALAAVLLAVSATASVHPPRPQRLEASTTFAPDSLAIRLGRPGSLRVVAGGRLLLAVGERPLLLPGRTAEQRAQAFVRALGGENGLVYERRSGLGAGRDEVVVTRRIGGRRVYGERLRIHLEGARFLAAVGAVDFGRRPTGSPLLSDAELEQALRRELRRLSLADRIPAGQAAPTAVPERYPVAPKFEDVLYPRVDGLAAARRFPNVPAFDGIRRYDVIVDATSGRVLECVPLTWFAAPSGNVFLTASPQPSATPGQAPPTPNPPAIASRTLVDWTGEAIASPSGWQSGSQLAGNNTLVREFQAWKGEWFADPSQYGTPIVASNRIFDFPLDHATTVDIREFSAAAGTNLFHWTNVAHDWLHGFGFDESHGNFQVDNLGRGGRGGDPLFAYAQLGSGRPGDTPFDSNNAWMSTPDDGSSPVMGMYVWGPFNGRWTDSSLDAEVVLHEFGHGVTGRLGDGWYGPQGGAMNEGNSDLFALFHLTPAAAPIDGAFTVGAYSFQNFAVGIRTFPYSSRAEVNPLHYRDYGHVSPYGHEVHADGEIWVQAMVEVWSRLRERYGHEEGSRRATQLLVDGLKLAASYPSMVDARDGILAADEIRYAGADVEAIWAGFAERGFGALATGGNAYSVIVQPDDLPPGPSARVRLSETEVYVGETVTAALVDTTFPGTPSITFRTAGGDTEVVAASGSAPIHRASIPSGSGTPVPGNGRLELSAEEDLTAEVVDPAPGPLPGESSSTARVRAPYFVSSLASAFDPALAGNFGASCNECWVGWRLPFSFELFGSPHTNVYASANGLVTFGDAIGASDPDPAVLADFPSIAPMWTDLDTSGNEGDGVFFESKPTHLTVRWQGRVRATGAPANVALTLFADSSIRIDYGPGNAFGSAPPLVGLGRGNGAFAQLVPSYTGAADLGNAPSLRFSACAPAGQAEVVPPSSARSGRSYDVRATGLEEVAIEFQESRDAAFVAATSVIVAGDRAKFVHSVGAATTYHYRARGIVFCGDEVAAEWSVPQSVVVEPSTSSLPALGDVNLANAWLIPAAARTAGAGGEAWRTDLQLAKTAYGDADATLYFLSRTGDNAARPGRSVRLAGLTATNLSDVLGDAFGVESDAGALLVVGSTDLLVGSRTYDASGPGTYGQYVPALPLFVDRVGTAATLIRLGRGERERTNIGLVNPAASPLMVEVELFRGDGESLGKLPRTIPAWGWEQIYDVFGKVGATEVEDGFARVRWLSGSEEWKTYASVVDNASGDPIFLLPAMPLGQPAWIAAAAQAPGIGGTVWRTDLALYSYAGARLRIDLLAQGGTRSSAEIELAAGTSRRFDGVLGELFAFAGAAALRIVPIAGDVRAASRTYNDSAAGRYGQFIAPVPESEFFSDEARVPFLFQSRRAGAGRRTNVGFVNPGGEEIALDLELIDGQGSVLATRTVVVPASSYLQEDEIFRAVASSDVISGTVLIRPALSGMRYLAYGSVVDNVTGDAVFVPAIGPGQSNSTSPRR